MTDSILYVKVAEPVTQSLAKAAETMEALERGESVTPYFSIGFADMGQLLAVLTPRRWKLIGLLREQGATSIAELARLLCAEPQQIEQDIAQLLTWSLVRQDTTGQVSAPYGELVVDVKLPATQAA